MTNTSVTLQRSYGYEYDPGAGKTYISMNAVVNTPDIYARTLFGTWGSSFELTSIEDIPNNQYTTVTAGLNGTAVQMWNYILPRMNNNGGLAGTTFVSGPVVDIPNNPFPFKPDWNQTDINAFDYIRNKPTIPSIASRSFSNPSRSLNTVFQISTTRDVQVSYSVDISATLSLTTGQQGTVYLEYADDNTFTTNVTEVARFVNGNSGTLTIGLGLTQNATGTLTGIIPTGKYVRIRTQNNTGTPTFTFRSAQEVLI